MGRPWDPLELAYNLLAIVLLHIRREGVFLNWHAVLGRSVTNFKSGLNEEQKDETETTAQQDERITTKRENRIRQAPDPLLRFHLLVGASSLRDFYTLN